MNITCISWKPFQRNTLVGFASIEIASAGIVIRECPTHRHASGRLWISFPGRAQIDRDGNVRRDPRTGKIAYSILVEAISKNAKDEFEAAALAAIAEAFPGALDPPAEEYQSPRSAPANRLPDTDDSEIPF